MHLLCAIHPGYIPDRRRWQTFSTESSSSSLGSRCVPWLGEGLSMPSPNYPVAAVVSRGWAKASACRLQIILYCAFRCHIVSLQYLSRSSLHRFAALPSRLLLSYGLQVVTREVHRSSLRRLICPAQNHFIFLTVLIISMTFFLSLTQMLGFLSLYVVLSILLSILVCAAASLFCGCLVSVQVAAPYVIAVHLSLQADGKVAFEEVPVFAVCRPACHDSSLYLFVLVIFLADVVLSQVHVALDIFYQHIFHVYLGVVYNHHLCLCDIHLETHSPTFNG